MAERNPYDDDADGASKPPSRRPEQAASDRIDEIRQYLSDLHARRNVIKRTVTKSGQELDWVPIESQTKNGKIAATPDETRAEIPHDRDRPTRRVPLELDDPDAELGPPGTVPLARYPIDLIAPDGDLRDWLSKKGHSRRMLPPDALVSPSEPTGLQRPRGRISLGDKLRHGGHDECVAPVGGVVRRVLPRPILGNSRNRRPNPDG
jgi:hypothetical protein